MASPRIKEAARTRMSERSGRSPVTSPKSVQDVHRAARVWGRDTPGPGSYSAPSTFAKAMKPGKPIGGRARIRQDHPSSNPGPGSHDAKYPNKPTFGNEGSKFSVGLRRNHAKFSVPGPGEYNAPNTFKRATMRGKPIGGRASKALVNTVPEVILNPGPGSHDFKDPNKPTFGNEGPKFSATGARHALGSIYI